MVLIFVPRDHWKYLRSSSWGRQDLIHFPILDPVPWRDHWKYLRTTRLDPFCWSWSLSSTTRSLEVLEDGNNQELLNEQLWVKNGDVGRPEKSQLTWGHNHTHPHYHHSSSWSLLSSLFIIVRDRHSVRMSWPSWWRGYHQMTMHLD